MIPHMNPKSLIIRTAGTNCDGELAYAFELAGAAVESVHLNQLVDQPQIIDQMDLIGFPGGFSYGDDISAGRIFANRLRNRLLEPLQTAVQRGVPMIGICNGFQVLVKMGLLPDPQSAVQTVTLTDNTSGRFLAKWVELNVPQDTVCIWTKPLAGRSIELPIAHGEGRFATSDPQMPQALGDSGQIALRYTDNPNGSMDDIAGICDPSGLILGLMPHPERCVHETAHPSWTRRAAKATSHATIGLQLIANAVEHVRKQSPAVSSST